MVAFYHPFRVLAGLPALRFTYLRADYRFDSCRYRLPFSARTVLCGFTCTGRRARTVSAPASCAIPVLRYSRPPFVFSPAGSVTFVSQMPRAALVSHTLLTFCNCERCGFTLARTPCIFVSHRFSRFPRLLASLHNVSAAASAFFLTACGQCPCSHGVLFFFLTLLAFRMRAELIAHRFQDGWDNWDISRIQPIAYLVFLWVAFTCDG